MPKPSRTYTKTVELQDALHESALLLKADIKDTKDRELRARLTLALSSAAKSYDTLEDRKRILKGKPMPGSLRPEKRPTKRPHHNKPRLLSIAQEPAQEPTETPAPAPEFQIKPEPKESLFPPDQPQESPG